MPHDRLRLRGFRLLAGAAPAALLAPGTRVKKKGTGAKASPCVRVSQDNEEGVKMKVAADHISHQVPTGTHWRPHFRQRAVGLLLTSAVWGRPE
jgi:hypothetical protein